MELEHLKGLLEAVAGGSLGVDQAVERLRHLPFEDLGYAKLDHHRSLRKGYAETIFGAGKTPEQIVAITRRMQAAGSNVLATRCSDEALETIAQAFPEATIHTTARAFTLCVSAPPTTGGYICVVSAGTTDLPVAEEAVVTAEAFGAQVTRVYDVGVAGIHRLFSQLEVLRGADCLVVCAGMEGALTSVIAGLVSCPVIGVPTSVGYGAAFGGVAPLLTMLNSCATGVAVTNIDNGFGAGALAATISRLADGRNP